MLASDEPPVGVRVRKKADARKRICDAVIELMADGRSDISHDVVAEVTGISRRTIYRYFPDREALLSAANTRVRDLAGSRVIFPASEQDLLDTPSIYEGLDRIAPIATLVRSTPQGRAMRLSQKRERQESYRAATADAVKDLPECDRVLATAILQVLHSTPWLEMRDHWDLNGTQIGRATAWAIRTLLADLRERAANRLTRKPEASLREVTWPSRGLADRLRASLSACASAGWPKRDANAANRRASGRCAALPQSPETRLMIRHRPLRLAAVIRYSIRLRSSSSAT